MGANKVDVLILACEQEFTIDHYIRLLNAEALLQPGILSEAQANVCALQSGVILSLGCAQIQQASGVLKLCFSAVSSYP
jgi:hypothetical protein